MNTEFTFFEDGVEKKGNLVMSFKMGGCNYVLYEIGENPDENNNDIVYVGKFYELGDGKLAIDVVTEEDKERIKKRLEIILSEFDS